MGADLSPTQQKNIFHKIEQKVNITLKTNKGVWSLDEVLVHPLSVRQDIVCCQRAQQYGGSWQAEE